MTSKCLSWSVDRVTCDGMSDVSHVHSDLVSTPCLKRQLNKCKVAKVLQNLKTCQSWLALCCDSLLLAVLVTTSNRRLDNPSVVW